MKEEKVKWSSNNVIVTLEFAVDLRFILKFDDSIDDESTKNAIFISWQKIL